MHTHWTQLFTLVCILFGIAAIAVANLDLQYYLYTMYLTPNLSTSIPSGATTVFENFSRTRYTSTVFIKCNNSLRKESLCVHVYTSYRQHSNCLIRFSLAL